MTTATLHIGGNQNRLIHLRLKPVIFCLRPHKAIQAYTTKWPKISADKAADGTFIKIPKGELMNAAGIKVNNLEAFVKN